jgi:AP-3 complex subunit delta
MSLLYECINGIIQGGILGDGEDFAAREEIASLCVSKLRGMISMGGDPNRESCKVHKAHLGAQF